MVRHIVTWNYGDGFSPEENQANALKVKEVLEGLAGVIDGLIEIKVYTEILPSGNKDIILNSLLESEEALAAYQIHPEHQKAAAFVRTVVKNRVCIDYCE